MLVPAAAIALSSCPDRIAYYECWGSTEVAEPAAAIINHHDGPQLLIRPLVGGAKRKALSQIPPDLASARALVAEHNTQPTWHGLPYTLRAALEDGRVVEVRINGQELIGSVNTQVTVQRVVQVDPTDPVAIATLAHEVASQLALG